MKIGDWLPNGTMVMFERSGVVLAFKENAAQPFCTWEWDGKDPSTTIWGHYYRSLSGAAIDFESRYITKEKRNAAGIT